MISISNEYKTAMERPIKQVDAYIEIDDNTNMTSADNLISTKISCETGLCKSAMRKLEISYLGDLSLVGKWIKVYGGVRLESGTFEYVCYGSFQITQATYTKDTGVTKATGYDLMLNAMKEYSVLNVTYPINLYDYTKELCTACGLELGNTSFVVNGTWPIKEELWENIDGITYRDIFVQIAQATASTCIIAADDKIYFKPVNTTNENLTYNNLKTFKVEEKYGPINSVILSRTPQEDNIYMSDDESININGLTEFKIENNEILDKDRDNALTPIFNALHGLTYYPVEVSTEGLGWFEIADSFNIVNSSEGTFNTILFNFSLTIDGGISETLKSTALTKTQTQYQYATTIAKRVKNTEIIVNKQEQYIENLVTDMYEEDGIVQENFTKVYQDINNIVSSVQNTGGNNLLLNSVMFAYDNDNIPSNWDVSGNGQLIISSSSEALSNGGVSGHVFTLLDKKVSQKINVTPDSDDIPTDEKIYYTFSTKIKKDATGTCYVKIYNSNEEHIIELNEGENSFYGDYQLQALLPKDNYYIIEFYGSEDSNATFTDNMFALGTYKSTWTQANGEIMNTQVNINIDGVLVKSSVYAGDYTIMSPLEFAGYSNLNGTITKVFTVNKDTTEVNKLKSKYEIKMYPIKIVPIIEGDIQGWAFVPTSEDGDY